MTSLGPETFFAPVSWQHASLVNSASQVWEMLGERLKEYLASWGEYRIACEVPAGVHLLSDRISIARGCRIEPGAVIIGPAIIGEGTVIRTGAYIRENVIAGDGCVIGAHSEVKGSVLLPGAKAPHQNYVGDSVLGAEVNLGAGTICSNVKNIGREVTLRVAGEVLHTGLRKLGAVLGDRCKTGCNTVLNPGALMGPDSITYPNTSLNSGYYPRNTLVKVRQQQQIVTLRRSETSA